MMYSFREMTIDDYDAVLALWKTSEGVDVAVGDARQDIARFLARNPGTSFVAVVDDRIVGAVLGGSDGRRGFVHHLAVEPDWRHRGAGRELVEACLQRLRATGVGKCHLFIRRDNLGGRDFWERIGWVERTELSMMSIDLERGGDDDPVNTAGPGRSS